MLGNITPKYRSTLRCIQLFAIVKSSILQQYGADKVLEVFMDDIKSLEQVHYCGEQIANLTGCM